MTNKKKDDPMYQPGPAHPTMNQPLSKEAEQKIQKLKGKLVFCHLFTV